MGLPIREFLDHLGYTLSLPERAARSLVAVAAGATKIATDALLPRTLRKSRTYAAILGNAQRFLIEKIGEVEGAYEADTAGLPENYVPRKIAGNILEVAGIFSVHLSPLWVFAIAADVASGSRVYLQRLAEQLRSDGLIEPDTPVNEIDDVFAALGKAGESSAKVFDTPPLTAKEIGELRNQLMNNYGKMFKEMGDLMPRIDTLWAQMQEVANVEGNLSRLAGLMSMDLNQVAGKAVNGAFAVGRATGTLVGEAIFTSYAESLADVRKRGFVACMDEATQPYAKAFWKHYSRARLSWTERLFRWFTGFFGKRPPDSAAPAALETKPDAPAALATKVDAPAAGRIDGSA